MKINVKKQLSAIKLFLRGGDIYESYYGVTNKGTSCSLVYQTSTVGSAFQMLNAGVDKYYEEYEDSSETDSLSTEITNNTGSNQPWKGFSVVFAGSIYGTNRFELKRISKLLGGKSFPRSVSKSTDNNVHGWKGIQQCFVLYRIE